MTGLERSPDAYDRFSAAVELPLNRPFHFVVAGNGAAACGPPAPGPTDTFNAIDYLI
jgi:hypothetical protein